MPGPGPGRGQRGPGQRQLGGDRVRACGLGEDGELPEQLAGPVQLEAQGAAGGQRQDASGLYYLRNRYYDPATGQFLTTDPLLDLTQAPYNYISDDPLNGTDLTGLCGFWCNVGIGALIGVAVTACIIAEPCGIASGGALALAGGGTLAAGVSVDVLLSGATLGAGIGAAGYALASGPPANGGTCPSADSPPSPRNLNDLSKSARTTTNEQYIFQRLKEYNSIDPNVASERLHEIKLENGLRGDENVTFDMSGNVYGPNGDYLGSLTQGGK